MLLGSELSVHVLLWFQCDFSALGVLTLEHITSESNVQVVFDLIYSSPSGSALRAL